MMRIDVITLFPDILKGPLNCSMMRRAQKLGAVEFGFVNPRDFATDVHRTTDDRPFGGGPGMVMKPEPLAAAIESVRSDDTTVIYLSPQGEVFDQQLARALASDPTQHIVFLCGHYEGIDERIVDLYVDREVSIGDYVLTNGALAAGVVIDATVRLLPGVLGGNGAAEADSFSQAQPILDHPHYTRPETFRDLTVPNILLSGNHAAIETWRHDRALERTKKRRPDLLNP